MKNGRFFLALIVLGLFFLVIGISQLAHAADPAIHLNVALTCPDINAIAAWKGWAEIERRARAAGASQAAIDKARQCLSSNR